MTLTSFSFITCSARDERFNSFKQNITRIFGRDTHIIRVPDAKSMAEGYNRGIRMATGDKIIFCHDDIEFLNSDAPMIIYNDLERYDIVGVAGTSRLVDGRWHSAGKKNVHGQVAHKANARGIGYQICVYGDSAIRPVVSDIQALDGLFFAVRRSTLKKMRFDESFDGFHLYDLDFTFSAYLEGFDIAVDNRIHLLHHSGGRYDQVWHEYFVNFNQKYANVLAKKVGGLEHVVQRFAVHSKDSLSSKMNHDYNGDPCNP